MATDENDTSTRDLLNSPVGPVLPTVTVEGWGTGTVAELELHLELLREERDAARRSLEELESPTVAQLREELTAARSALADLERATGRPDAIDGADLVAVITRIAERAATDANAVWYAIEDRVEETAAEAARQVIRDELVVNVDLI